jgi:hypothetical protein
LLRLARDDFPHLAFPDPAFDTPEQDPTPRLEDRDWGGPRRPEEVEELEAIIGRQSTFLPVSFLETGAEKARAVARVVRPSCRGTGFLTSGDLLITAHHVIPDVDAAREAKVEFGYEQLSQGGETTPRPYLLDPKAFFATSRATGHEDWTAVRVKGRPSRSWGSLKLRDVSVSKEDRVSIIQHPEGRPKQIALFHNVVAFADGQVVQYLTDTMRGSSGSPVFNDRWEVVAVHRKGGWTVEPRSRRRFFRNEGVPIGRVIKGIEKARAATRRRPARAPSRRVAPAP